MDREGLKKSIRERLFKGLNIPLKAMPLWMEAIGVGVFISSIVENNPSFKERLSEIDGKLFLFEARDIQKRFHLLIKDNDIKIIPHSNRAPDVTMRGDVKTLIDVLTGKEDPDTVFFSRKLEINGDTAAAIHLKNMLAALG